MQKDMWVNLYKNMFMLSKKVSKNPVKQGIKTKDILYSNIVLQSIVPFAYINHPRTI